MNTKKIAVSSALLSLVLGLPAASLPAASGQARDFDFTYTATVAGLPPEAREVEVWIPYPESDAYQQVEVRSVASDHPTTMARDPESGNAVLHLTVRDPGQREIRVEMAVRVRRRERLESPGAAAPSPRPATRKLPPEVAKWLEPDELVPLSERIRKLAVEVTRGRATELAKARAIYDYVVDTMSYDKSGTGWGRGDIYWACDAKRGNCTDFHSLFIGLARAVGIPAKFAIGFPLPAESGAGEIGGYHCWSEFYLAGRGWIPIDASEARKHPEKREYFFGNHDANRVQFSVGRDLHLAPRQKGGPLNFFVYPYVEVDGRPFSQVNQKFSYRDLGAPAGGA